MELLENQFKILFSLWKEPGLTQRELASSTELGLGTINIAYRDCVRSGLIENKRLSAKGMAALKPYEVENAIILAAGLSSRFAPISYEKPKGLLTVRGEVLIERQIKQLQAAGINDVVVVVGYKQELFFYLEEKLNVKIVVNKEYAERNNNSSLMLVRDILDNTYICSSDNYFEINPFESHVWKAYYSAEYIEGNTKEWCITSGSQDRITMVSVGGKDSWCMIGHAYFDRTFSRRFRAILEDEYDLPQTRDKLWEDLYVEHIKELDMRIRRYDPPIIHEFDSLDELRSFDPHFLENLDSNIFDNITAVLGCTKREIRDVFPLKQGITNLSCHFSTDDGEFVYRHPGIGTESLVDRSAEYEALNAAKQLGLDTTFIFENPRRGWKVSRYIPDCRPLNSRNDEELKAAMQMARRLHESNVSVERHFSFYLEGKAYGESLLGHGAIQVSDYDTMKNHASLLNEFLLRESHDLVLCHNDFFGPNFLVHDNGHIDLIDWEYAGMGDYANDFGTFAVCEQLTEDEMMRALTYYFDAKPTKEQWRHNIAIVGMAGWCWYVWALLKEAEGDNVGEWTYIYYRYAKAYLSKALALYQIPLDSPQTEA